MKIIEHLEQGSQEWLESRAGVITGTRLKAVMGRKDTRTGLIYELIAEKLSPLKENYKTEAMEMGNIKEDILKDLLDENIEEVGFIQKNNWIGISPDGIQRDKQGKVTKAFEIKSPEAKNYIKYYIENKIPAEYKWQVVMYFIVIEDLKELDFIIFNPEIYDENYRLKTIKVKREDILSDIEKANLELEEFRNEWINKIKQLQGSS